MERFLRYVAVDTQSDPQSETFPSTAKQLTLLNRLVEEMLARDHRGRDRPERLRDRDRSGDTGVRMETRHRIDLACRYESRHGGGGVRTRLSEHYDGNDIRLNDTLTMRVADFPELAFFKGHTLITTDGTTLLGADDKAGVAEIMTAADYLMAHPEIPHGKLRIGFTPDEEIGRGVDFFDVERFRGAFRLHGGRRFRGRAGVRKLQRRFEREIVVQGRNIHPGYAKDKMINALQVACEINSLLPAVQRPEHTEDYDGFYHLVGMNGTVEKASMEYIIRDHSREMFEAKKRFLADVPRCWRESTAKGRSR